MAWFGKRQKVKEYSRYNGRVSGLLRGTLGEGRYLSEGYLSIGPIRIKEGDLVRQGQYRLTSTQLVYVITMEGSAYKSGTGFLHHWITVPFNDLSSKTLSLVDIRACRVVPLTTTTDGFIHVTLVDGTAIRLTLRPANVNGPRLTGAINETQRLFGQLAIALGADDSI